MAGRAGQLPAPAQISHVIFIRWRRPKCYKVAWRSRPASISSLASTEFQASCGSSSFDRIALHRVTLGPNPPVLPNLVMLYLPGTNMNGEVAIDDPRYSPRSSWRRTVWTSGRSIIAPIHGSFLPGSFISSWRLSKVSRWKAGCSASRLSRLVIRK